MTDPKIKLLFDAPTIERKVKALGLRLQEDGVTEDVSVISVLGGSVVFLVDLVRTIRDPVRFDFIRVRYSESDEKERIRQVDFPLPVDIGGQSLLILKDVVHSGITELYLEEELRERGAEEIRFIALIDLPDERKTDFEPDYRLFAAERPGTFIGYGLKHEGRYGNLPYIGRLNDG